MSIENLKNKKATVWEILLYYTTAVALPNIFLFNVYNQNRDGGALIIFNHVLILALILAVTSAVGLLITRLLTRNYEGSLLVILFGWLFFWFFEALLRRLPMGSRAVLLGMILIVLLCFIILFRIISDRLRKIGIGFMAIAGVISLLFVFNAIPTLMGTLRRNSVVEQRVDGAPIQREFYVDNTLQSPDIYWFHVDALISLSSAERYFDISQDETRNSLLNLGFVINEDAEYIAHNTVFGVPGLLSPNFYDNYLHDLFMEGRHLLRGERQRILFDAIETDGISLANDIAPYHELFHAFLQAGYRTVMIADLDQNVFAPIDKFYRLFDPSVYAGTNVNQEYIFTIGDGAPLQNHFLADARDLIELLSLMTPVPARFVNRVVEIDLDWETIPDHTERINELTADTLNLDVERQLYRNLLELLERPLSQPTLTYITIMFGHPWSWSTVHGRQTSPTEIHLYPAAREYALNVTFNMIDLILERNPNAIIVLQADHGIHFARSQRTLLANGLTEAEVIGLHNSVFSAVRIPEIYGGLDAPLDPRNIARELVNRFVGPNYELRTD